jgi:hypothetical protein
MCDYSLHGVNNRLAKQGESLFVRKFPTGSKGLASSADLDTLKQINPAPQGSGVIRRLFHWIKEARRVASEELPAALPAVCVPPGARLYIEGIPHELRERYALGEAEEVTFTQLTSEPFRYRDAFRFPNGEEVIIQKFAEGVRVEVLQLALVGETEEEAEVKGPAAVATNLIERSMRANA